MTPWLIVICVYFGRWPTWMNFFVETCKWNTDVHWRIYTDCGEPENDADNIKYVHTSFTDYKAFVRDRLAISFAPDDPYKICDLRPCFGHLHEEDIAAYPFFGYGDLDVIYGRISAFYNEVKFHGCDVISSHRERLSGHLAVFRNTSAIREAYKRIPDYRQRLEAPTYLGLDEIAFAQLFLGHQRTSFVERYSTVLSSRGWHDGTMNYPQRWFWRRGCLTNERDGDRQFLYLHFMRWQSSRWVNNPPQPGEGAWVGRDILGVDWRVAATDGFSISPEGFSAIDWTRRTDLSAYDQS